MSVEALKLELINKIIAVDDNKKLKKIEATLFEIDTDDKNRVLERLSKPIRKKLNIEELKKEQNFKPIDKAHFFKKIEELNIEEPIEDLLKMI